MKPRLKRWIPFWSALALGLGGAAAWHAVQRHQLASLPAAPVVRTVAFDPRALPPGGARKSTGAESAAMARIDATMAPTRNGIRSLFQRSRAILSLSREEVESLLVDLEQAGRPRSPIAAISLMAAYARLAELDPAAAMNRAGSLKSEMRDIASFAGMTEWLAKDRKAAVAWFQSQPDAGQKQRFLGLMTFASSADPSLISELTGTITDPAQRAQVVRDSIRAMAWSNPEGALARLSEIEDPDERAEAERDCLRGLASREPERAVAMAFAKPLGDPSRSSAVDLVRQWSERDGSAALTWLTSQPKEIRAEVLSEKGVRRGFESASPSDVKSAALKLDDPAQRDRLHAAWINAQSSRNPEAGFAQLSQIKDSAVQTSSAEALAREAARQDNRGAMETWLESNPPAPVRHAAIARYAESVGRNDPIAGREWADRITDPKVRAEVIGKLPGSEPKASP